MVLLDASEGKEENRECNGQQERRGKKSFCFIIRPLTVCEEDNRKGKSSQFLTFCGAGKGREGKGGKGKT